jgi:uncharacterized membrane protein
VQEGKQLNVPSIRAVGTEPFWSAQIEGRCVTYSQPENSNGTRVWTRYSANASGGTWTGALGGKPFVLRSVRQAGCSDGMSDRHFPLKVEITVAGELRTGCGEPSSEQSVRR